MKNRLGVLLVLVSLSFSIMPGFAVAEVTDGILAYIGGDYATALKEFKPLAIKGNSFAQYNLGLMYNNGQGVSQDYKEAVKWFRLAADQGDASAQYNLGMNYNKGQGVLQDYKEAVKWFRLAANQRHVFAQSNLGAMYDSGKGVPQDYKEAVKWYRIAANQGESVAQSNLGFMYANGYGVPVSKIIAYTLFNISAATDPSDENGATKNRTIIAKNMTQKEIEEGQTLSREMTKPGNLLKALDAYVAKKGNKPTPKKKKKK